MSTRPLWRATMLPPAQLIAASSTSSRPAGVVPAPVLSAMMAMPATASASAAHWKPRTRSRSSAIASPIVKKTWVWITSEASPGEMWPRIAT